MGGNVNTVFTGDTTQLVKALNKSLDATTKTNKELVKQIKNTKAVERAGRGVRNEASAGASAFKRMGVSVTSVGIAATAAAATTIRALRSIRAEAERGAEILTQEADLGIKLRQVAGGDTPKERAENLRGVKQVVRKLTTQMTRNLTNQAVGAMLFSMKSAPDILPPSDLGMLSKLGMLSPDPALMVKALVQTQSVFSEGGAGTNRQVLNQMFVAGGVSKTLDPEELVPFAVSLMSTFRNQKFTFPEALSFVGQFAPGFKGPEEAATAGTAFAKFASQKKFTGNFLQQFQQFQELPTEERDKLLFANIRFKKGFLAVAQGQKRFAESVTAIEAAKRASGTPAAEMQIGLGAFALDPEQVAAAQTRRAREVDKLRAREEGIGFAARDLAGSLGTASLEEAWARGVSRAFTNYLETVQPIFEFEPHTIRQAAEMGPVVRSMKSLVAGEGLVSATVRSAQVE